MFGKRQPILPSRPPTSANQLELIYQLCGTPTGETEARLSRCDGWDKYPSSAHHEPKLREKYQTSMSPACIDLLEKLLCLNPDEVCFVIFLSLSCLTLTLCQRITAERALHHPYFYSDGGTLSPDRLPRIPDIVEDIHEYDIQKKKIDQDDSAKRERAQQQAEVQQMIRPLIPPPLPPNNLSSSHPLSQSGSAGGRGRGSFLSADPRARYRAGRPSNSPQPPPVVPGTATPSPAIGTGSQSLNQRK
jgi:hypothetical protein